jgi:hypothetical protein
MCRGALGMDGALIDRDRINEVQTICHWGAISVVALDVTDGWERRARVKICLAQEGRVIVFG